MRLRFVFIIFLAICIDSNTVATTNDTIYVKCTGQSGAIMVPSCSCQIGFLMDSSGEDLPKRDSLDSNQSLPSGTVDNNDFVILDTNSIGPEPSSDVVSLITLIVNDFNNVLSEINNSFSLISIIIGVFGLLIGVLGILGFNNLKNDYRDLKKGLVEQIIEQDRKIQVGIDEIKTMRNDVKVRTDEIERIQNQQNYQIQYLERNNQYLFSITNSIIDINGSNNEKALDIRNRLLNQYYIVRTYLPWSDGPADSTQAAFMYLQFNGTMDNIDDLQFIADKDPDERKRRIALETIGYIRARFDSSQTS